MIFLEYLEEKVKSFREAASDLKKVEVTAEKPTQSLTFYVAECMEFPTLWEYHENLNFAEAVRLYESIPSERMNAIKGIGFVLHTEGNEEYRDSTMELLNGMTVDVDGINSVPELIRGDLPEHSFSRRRKLPAQTPVVPAAQTKTAQINGRKESDPADLYWKTVCKNDI